VLARAGYESLGGARFFINGMDTRTQGIDVDARYRLAVPRGGLLQLSAGYNRSKTGITRLINDLHPLAQIPGLVLFGRLERERIERGQPRSKLNVTVEWQRRRLAATLRATRYGEVFAPAANWRDDYVIDPEWIADIELRYASSRIELALGSENVFDRYPKRAPTGARPSDLGGYFSVNNYILPFSGFSPFGFGGRYVYGRVTCHF
jgi:iron complex outermembrane receptor protein